MLRYLPIPLCYFVAPKTSAWNALRALNVWSPEQNASGRLSVENVGRNRKHAGSSCNTIVGHPHRNVTESIRLATLACNGRVRLGAGQGRVRMFRSASRVVKKWKCVRKYHTRSRVSVRVGCSRAFLWRELSKDDAHECSDSRKIRCSKWVDKQRKTTTRRKILTRRAIILSCVPRQNAFWEIV